MWTILEKWFVFINGKKSYIGMIGAVATFIAFSCNVLGDGVQLPADFEAIGGAFSAMMLALGFGHKLKKIEEASKK